MSVELDGKDIIAAITLIGVFTLKALGYNSVINYILLVIVTAYFGYGSLELRKILKELRAS